MPYYIFHMFSPSSFFNILFFPQLPYWEKEKSREDIENEPVILKENDSTYESPDGVDTAHIRNGTINKMVSALCDLMPPESVSPGKWAGSQDATKYELKRSLYNCSYVRMLFKHSFFSF